MASESDYRAAIARVRSIWSFDRSDLDLAERAGSQMGSMGSDAREALRLAKDELKRFQDIAGSKGNFARDMLSRMR